MNDEELVELLRLNDEVTFSEIFKHYRKLVFYTARKVTQSEEPAQDVVQNVFLNPWHRQHDVEIVRLKAHLRQATHLT